ncbi:MAG: DUF47 domain-containing protein [Methylococcaceae bacterium]|nr:DUF47 domain-containing protein [Methylococcaceae bacterium]
MNTDNSDRQNPRSLEIIFKDHLANTMECGQVLSQLFSNLEEPDLYIAKVKYLEEKGDKLTAEAYYALELLAYSEFIHLIEQLVKHLDDIVDGINNTARLIDICHPWQIENAAQEILSTLLSMIARLQMEMEQYPENELASVKACREMLKKSEENADVIYHEWRKTQRRILVLPLVDETNWTEILGILEQTTDAAYHAVLSLERIVRYRLRQ